MFVTNFAQYVERWNRPELADRIRRIGGLDTHAVSLNGDKPT
jgi:hypothetical protein